MTSTRNEPHDSLREELRTRLESAEAEVERFKTLVLSVPFGHDHWDPKGTSGTNCRLCIDHRRWRDRRDAALRGEEVKP